MSEERVNWVALGLDLAVEAAQGKEMVAATISGKKLVLAQYQGQWHAFQKSCPHAGGDLYTGWINDEGCVVCPLHRYTFDIRSGENTSGEGLHLSTYPVKEERGLWWIGFPKRRWFKWF